MTHKYVWPRAPPQADTGQPFGQLSLPRPLMRRSHCSPEPGHRGVHAHFRGGFGGRWFNTRAQMCRAGKPSPTARDGSLSPRAHPQRLSAQRGPP